MKWVFGILFFLCLFPLNINAQEDSIRYIIETTDGNEYNALILEENNEFITLQTDYIENLRLPRNYIKSIKSVKVSELNQGEFWFENPHSTRYFYSPNGYNLEKGEAYYQNTWVFFNQLSYGISHRFSMGLGMMPIFLVGAGAAPVWITPKIGIPLKKDKYNLGIGVLAGKIIGEETSLGITYTTLTIGSRDHNTTLGGGWAFTDEGWADYPTLALSAMARFSKKGYFLTENYLISSFNQTIGIISLGGRTVQKKLAVDYGLIIPVNSGADMFIAVPWLSITIPFGNISFNQE